jgi:hypothetical protein
MSISGVSALGGTGPKLQMFPFASKRANGARQRSVTGRWDFDRNGSRVCVDFATHDKNRKQASPQPIGGGVLAPVEVHGNKRRSTVV